MNKVILIGRLTADPELRVTTTSAIPVARFSVAVDRPFAKEGQQDVDYVDCIAWRKLGEAVAQYMHKGSLVAVEGRLQIRAYETQDGRKGRAAEVVADDVRFLEPKSKGEAQSAPAAEPVTEEVPF